MSLPYTTGHTRPQETLIAAALRTRLGLLDREHGLFLRHVGELPAMPSRLRDDAWDIARRQMGAQAPAAFVVLDSARTREGDSSGHTWQRDYDITIAVYSNHRRDTVSGRLDPDVVSTARNDSDPGMRAMCELIDSLILGWNIDVDGVYEVRPGSQGMQTVYAGIEGTLRELHYVVKAELSRARWPDMAAYLEHIQTTYGNTTSHIMESNL